VQLRAIGSEVDPLLSRCCKNGRAFGCWRERSQLAVRCLPRLHQIIALQVEIIEEVRSKARLRDNDGWDFSGSGRHIRPLPARVLKGKLRDDLWLALVKELKVIFAKIPNGSTLRISHHYMHRRKPYIHLEGGDCIRCQSGRRTLACRCLRTAHQNEV
jgi:hypothetical protein